MKLIIIDDDETLCRTLARRFSQQAYNVDYFSQPISCEQLIAQQATHYLLDMRFATQSGLAFIAPLRQALPNCRIIMLTGYASIASAVQAVKLGADDYLTKPVSFVLLAAAMAGDAETPQTEKAPSALLTPEQMEWEHIQRVLQENNGNISQTSRLLGMHRRTLQRKLLKHRP